MNSFRPVLGFDFPGGSDGKSICLQCRRSRFDPWVRKMPWRRKWQPIPITLAWKIPWMEEPGRLHSMGSQRVGHDWATSLSPLLFLLLLLQRAPLFLIYLLIFIFDCAGPLLLCGFSLVVASGGYSLVAVHRLLIAVASFVEHGL